MNWTRDVKEVFLTALDKLEGDRMTRGANAGDLYTFFCGSEEVTCVGR